MTPCSRAWSSCTGSGCFTRRHPLSCCGWSPFDTTNNTSFFTYTRVIFCFLVLFSALEILYNLRKLCQIDGQDGRVRRLTSMVTFNNSLKLVLRKNYEQIARQLNGIGRMVDVATPYKTHTHTHTYTHSRTYIHNRQMVGQFMHSKIILYLFRKYF